MSTSYQSKFFTLAALWNVFWGVSFMFFHRQLLDAAGVDFDPTAVNTAFVQFVGMAVFSFSVFYYLCGVNLERYQLLCWFGILGKLATFAIFFGHSLSDPSLLIVAMTGGLGDFIWAILFYREIRTLKDKAISPIALMRGTA